MRGILLQSLLAGAATLLGSLAVLALGRPGEKTLALLLSAAGGVMIAVVGLDLLPSAFHYGGLTNVLAGFFFGFALLWVVGLLFSALEPGAAARSRLYLLRMGYLIALGIAFHDLPEGMAIAAGYSATERLGGIIALAIGLHNIPEGMATTTPLVMGGLHPAWILGINALISLFTPLGALLGITVISVSSSLLAALLALAGGAMFYLAYCQLLPEARRRHLGYSWRGFLLGALCFGVLNLLH